MPFSRLGRPNRFKVSRLRLDGEQEAHEKWSAIPEDLDILITHGPPQGVLDSVGSVQAGCPELMPLSFYRDQALVAWKNDEK